MAPQTKAEDMSANIVECYGDFTKDKFDTDPLTEADIEVKDMTPADYINPWRRSWWVAVPYRMKAVFEDENFYPNQWKFRQFYPARSNKKWKPSTESVSPSRLLLEGV